VIYDNHGEGVKEAGGLLAGAAAAAAWHQVAAAGSVNEGKQPVEQQQQQPVPQDQVGCAACEDLVATRDGG